MLNVMTSIIRFRFTPSAVDETLKAKEKPSTMSPKRNVKRNVNGPKAGRDNADKKPPIRPTYVAPAFPRKRLANASITA